MVIPWFTRESIPYNSGGRKNVQHSAGSSVQSLLESCWYWNGGHHVSLRHPSVAKNIWFIYFEIAEHLWLFRDIQSLAGAGTQWVWQIYRGLWGLGMHMNYVAWLKLILCRSRSLLVLFPSVLSLLSLLLIHVHPIFLANVLCALSQCIRKPLCLLGCLTWLSTAWKGSTLAEIQPVNTGPLICPQKLCASFFRSRIYSRIVGSLSPLSVRYIRSWVCDKIGGTSKTNGFKS